METPAITVSCQSDFWTHYRATRAVVGGTLINKIRWAFFAGIPLMALAGMWASKQDIFSSEPLGVPAWMLAAGVIVLVAVLVPLLELLNVAGLRRRNPSIGGVITYTISPDGYMVRGATFESILKWPAFLKVVETKEFLLFYVSSRWAHFIPLSAFSVNDLHEVRTIVRGQLGAKARLRDVV